MSVYLNNDMFFFFFAPCQMGEYTELVFLFTHHKQKYKENFFFGIFTMRDVAASLTNLKLNMQCWQM